MLSVLQNGHQTAHKDRSDLENLKVKFKKLQAELKLEKSKHQKVNYFLHG